MFSLLAIIGPKMHKNILAKSVIALQHTKVSVKFIFFKSYSQSQWAFLRSAFGNTSQCPSLTSRHWW